MTEQPGKRGRWTLKDDEFLLQYHEGVGADFIASHDLGRPEGSGGRRIVKLQQSGALAAYARHRIALIDFMVKAGHVRAAYDLETLSDEAAYWGRLIGGEA